MMSAGPSTPYFIPPTVSPPPEDLSSWQLARTFRRNALEGWPVQAYERPLTYRRFFGSHGFLINDPKGIDWVLNTNADNYERPVIARRLLRPGTGDGVFLAEGENWRHQRRILAPIFTPRHLETMAQHFLGAAETLVARLGDGGRFNLAVMFQETAFDVLCRAVFSLTAAERGGRIAELVRLYFNGPGLPRLWDFIARQEDDFRWFSADRRAFSRIWFAEVDSIIADRLSAARATDAPRDLLDLLIAARDPDTGQGLTRDQIRNQAATMLAAGFETTARAMFWAVYLLALVPQVQKKVRWQLVAEPGAEESLTGMKRLDWLRATLFEALRLYPPAAVMSRVAKAADTVLGETVPAGAMVMVSPWVLHRHRLYWSDPDAFIPERFMGEGAELLPAGGGHGAFIPFGIGPRVCLGAAFAVGEATAVLATLLRHFTVTLDDDRPVVPISTLATVPSIEPWFKLTRAPCCP